MKEDLEKATSDYDGLVEAAEASLGKLTKQEEDTVELKDKAKAESKAVDDQY